MLDFGLVREALRERGLLLDRIAPHLVKPVPFLYPLQHRIWERGVRRDRGRALRRDGLHLGAFKSRTGPGCATTGT